MLRLGKEVRVTEDEISVTAFCREGWVVTHRPLYIPGAEWTLRRLEGENEADHAAFRDLLQEAAEADCLVLRRPRDTFIREAAAAMSADGYVCVFEHCLTSGEAVGWRMCAVQAEDFMD